MRRILRIIAASCMGVAVASSAVAENYPTAPIKLLVGFAAGGGTDTVARIYAQKLEPILKQPVIVENKPGAAQLIATRSLMAAKPDGYTLMFSTAAFTQAPAFRDGVNYDPAKDVTLIAMILKATGVFIIDPKLPIKNLGELFAYAKSNPGKVTYATSGVGSPNHIAIEYLMNATGTKMTHVPYKSDQEATFEVASGRVNFALTIANFCIPIVKEGRVRALAVTGSEPLADLPGVPTLAEVNLPNVKPLGYHTYYVLLGPSGVDPAIVDKLNKAVAEVSAMPDVKERVEGQLYMSLETLSPQALSTFMQEDAAMWRQLAQDASLRF